MWVIIPRYTHITLNAVFNLHTSFDIQPGYAAIAWISTIYAAKLQSGGKLHSTGVGEQR
jgi:hypothetical protein